MRAWFNWRNPEGILPGGLEDRYRSRYLPEDVSHAVVGMVLLVFPLLPFACADYYVFGTGTRFPAMLAMRGILFLYTVALIIRLRKNKGPCRV